MDISKILVLDSEYYNDCVTYEEKFSRLANYMLNGIDLIINNRHCIIREIEFYLHTDDHQDIYTHRNIDQSTPKKWYFHKTGNTYKGGTYKGLDITFGFTNKTAYGGILIRGISDITDPNKIIDIIGPCKTVDYILEHTNSPNICDLVKKLANSDVDDNNKLLYLRLSNGNIHQTIYNGVRVGLSFKYLEWCCKYYRFMTWRLSQIEKNRPNIVVILLNRGIPIKEIQKESKYSIKKIEKYKEIYETGKLLDLEQIKNLPVTANNIISVCGYLGI